MESAQPEGWDKLYLPTVKALVSAGESVVDDLRRISSNQGLASKPMAIALWNLFQLERATTGDLARRCGCDAGNLSNWLDRLEEEGLIERVADTGDRRVRRVHLTPKGRRLGARIQTEYKQSGFYRELSRLSSKEREDFTAILARIAAAAGH